MNRKNRTSDVTIITEASSSIGFGHLKRCLTLSKELKSRGLEVKLVINGRFENDFLSNVKKEYNIVESGVDVPFHSPYIIRDLKRGNNTITVKQEVKSGSVVLLLDEKGEARKVATIVSDVFMTEEERKKLAHGRYTKYLYGLQYSIIDRDFSPKGKVDKRNCLFIYISWADPYNITYKLVAALNAMGFRGPSVIILSPKNRYYTQTSEIIKKWNNSIVYTYKSNIYYELATSKLTVTKIGTTMVESFFVGTPCITIEPTVAHLELHQRLINAYPNWPAFLAGIHYSINYKNIAIQIKDILSNDKMLSKMGKEGKILVDGKGTTRIINTMMEIK